MTEQPPPIPIGEPEWDRNLWRMVAASGVLHVIAIALLIVLPPTFLHRPPPLKSYTVDLIAPDRLGGTNMIAGGKGRIEGPPMAAAPKVEAPKPPPPPKVEQPKPPEPEPPKPEPKVEPPKPEPPKEVAKPEPKPPPEPPKENEAVLADKAAAEEKAAAQKVAAEKAAAQKAAAEKAAAEKAAQKAAAEKVAAQKAAAEKAAAEKAAAQKAAAQKAAAEKAAKEAAAAHARDERIEAAVKRMQQQTGKRGAGSGTQPGEQPGAPISVGPGEGAGGTVKGVEYLLYYNQMINRIKQVWAWAGANQTLQATVGFTITETGDIVNVRIRQPSGDPSYDASVERAVRAANPLPPPPEAYRKQFNDVEIEFSPKDLAG